MTPAAARFALAAGFSALLADQALAQAKPETERLPSAQEVGAALALADRCSDTDGFTLCSPTQPAGATFRKVLCAIRGSDLERRPIATCVYKGAQMEMRTYFRAGPRSAFVDYGDGAIDLTLFGGHWLPNAN